MKFWRTPRGRQELAGVVGALLLSFAAACAVTWPTLPNANEVVLGGGELGGWLWRYDWHFRSLEGVVAATASPLDQWLAFVGLGRYPETGNILDVLALSYPLQEWLGFPLGYNVKIFLILAGNGLAGYGLARYFSGSISASLTACVLAVVNPLTLLEVQACGLRQAILWWVLLFPAVLDRALRRRTLPDALVAGAVWGLAGAFYWFYGLFTGIFAGAWLVRHLVSERGRLPWGALIRVAVGGAVGVLVGAGPFIVAYTSGATSSGAGALPEMTFFLPFPAYDTVSQAPLRPSSYAENLLASIHRTIGSSWTAFYPIDPTLNEGMPLAVMIFGIFPAIWRRKSWGWLAIWFLFYLGTLGPYLRIGSGDAENVYRVGGDYVVRMPYQWMFQFIPGMSRMFAPYRLGAYVVVCSVALVAVGLSRLRWRAWLAPVVIVATVVQPMLRLGKGSVNEGDADSRELRSPIKINKIKVPAYYRNLDPTELGGIVEVPVDQQQDLLYYYQVIHGQKVYRSWASPGAVPPLLRAEGSGGEDGERLRYLARLDVVSGDVPEALDKLSRDPLAAPVEVLATDAFPAWAKTNSYRRLILHERGYYLVDPARGRLLFESAVRRLEQVFGRDAGMLAEIRKGDPLNPELGVPIVGDLVPWSSQPTDLPAQRAPSVYRMAVFPVPGMDMVETPANEELLLAEKANREVRFLLVGPGGVPLEGSGEPSAEGATPPRPGAAPPEPVQPPPDGASPPPGPAPSGGAPPASPPAELAPPG